MTIYYNPNNPEKDTTIISANVDLLNFYRLVHNYNFKKILVDLIFIDNIQNQVIIKDNIKYLDITLVLPYLDKQELDEIKKKYLVVIPMSKLYKKFTKNSITKIINLSKPKVVSSGLFYTYYKNLITKYIDDNEGLNNKIICSVLSNKCNDLLLGLSNHIEQNKDIIKLNKSIGEVEVQMFTYLFIFSYYLYYNI